MYKTDIFCKGRWGVVALLCKEIEAPLQLEV